MAWDCNVPTLNTKEPFSFSLHLHDFEIAAFNAIRASDNRHNFVYSRIPWLVEPGRNSCGAQLQLRLASQASTNRIQIFKCLFEFVLLFQNSSNLRGAKAKGHCNFLDRHPCL
jgi:hypothetical protein